MYPAGEKEVPDLFDETQSNKKNMSRGSLAPI